MLLDRPEGEGYQTLLNRILKENIGSAKSTSSESDMLNLVQGQVEMISMLKQLIATKEKDISTEQRSAGNSTSYNVGSEAGSTQWTSKESGDKLLN